MGVYVHVYSIHIHIFVIIRAVIDIPVDSRVSGGKAQSHGQEATRHGHGTGDEHLRLSFGQNLT